MRFVTRRNILGGVGSAAVAMGLTSYIGCMFENDELVAKMEPLDIILPDLVDASRIGEAARLHFGMDDLYQAALSNSQIMSALSISCERTRRSHLLKASQAEFGTRQVIVCDKFVLSRIEVIAAGLRAFSV